MLLVTGGPWTRHGHAIPGVTVAGSSQPASVARCGGPAICAQCAKDAATQQAAHGVQQYVGKHREEEDVD